MPRTGAELQAPVGWCSGRGMFPLRLQFPLGEAQDFFGAFGHCCALSWRVRELVTVVAGSLSRLVTASSGPSPECQELGLFYHLALVSGDVICCFFGETFV